jgi:adenine deaminase
MQIVANYINIFDQVIYPAQITIEEQRIMSIVPIDGDDLSLPYILPGFVDAHVHIESSLLTPSQFARLAVVHGTVATVSDPHEIANVLGMAGVTYMIEDGKRVPFNFCFGAPSCVPATTFETAGATITSQQVKQLLAMKEIGYLAEMMNFPGVLHQDPEVMAKIALAQAFNKPIDGHAPGLRGDQARQYIQTGISTDHECFSYDEALEKIRYGMKIIIREGSAAKNFDELLPLLAHYPDRIMFCSDDKHADSLVAGHINQLVMRALQGGYDLFSTLRAACINPVLHYRMDVGLLREGDWADFILIDNLTDLNIINTYIKGQKVAEKGQSLIMNLSSNHPNNFHCAPCQISDFEITAPSTTCDLRVIEALDGQLITNALILPATITNNQIVADTERDILKIAVINRYHEAPIAIGFIKNFGLKKGAMASSVAHDSHNIIAVGCDDESLCAAINLIIDHHGGLSAVHNNTTHILPLPIAGLMTDEDGYKVSDTYTVIDRFSKDVLGSTLSSPFMTLSFMGLLVIPALKMSDLGLFDGSTFRFTNMIVKK